jgi:transcriptional regulator with XRE-family HTH domain
MFLQSKELDELKRFGSNLRRIRKEKKLSMEALANLAEIELSQIYRIETGKINPKLTTVMRIVKALKVNIEDLFTSS